MDTPTTTTTINPLSPSGLSLPNVIGAAMPNTWNNMIDILGNPIDISNGPNSTIYSSGITDFISVVNNPFIFHRLNNRIPIKIVVSGTIGQSESRFDIYSSGNRINGPTNVVPSSITTTPWPPASGLLKVGR